MRIMESSTTTANVQIEKVCSTCRQKGHWAREHWAYEKGSA